MIQLTYALVLLIGAALGVGGERLLRPTSCLDYVSQMTAELRAGGFTLAQHEAQATTEMLIYVDRERTEARGFAFESDEEMYDIAREAGWKEQGVCVRPDGGRAMIFTRTFAVKPTTKQAQH